MYVQDASTINRYRIKWRPVGSKWRTLRRSRQRRQEWLTEIDIGRVHRNGRVREDNSSRSDSNAALCRNRYRTQKIHSPFETQRTEAGIVERVGSEVAVRGNGLSHHI